MGLDIPHGVIGLSGLYNTPDPFLRRLRIDEPSGSSILDNDKYFKDREVLVVYAGSEQGSNNLREFHKGLTSLALRQLKTCSILYVSTDTDPKAQQKVTANVPWLKLTFNDNSDFAPLATEQQAAKIVEIEEVERGEEFIQAGEIELGIEKVQFGVEEYQHDYVRPLSRAAVTALIHAYSTPSISIYHIPSHTFVAKNVKPSAFSSSNIDKNYNTWRNGGSPSIRLTDILGQMKWAVLALIVALFYRLIVTFGGERYNVLPGFVAKLGWQGSRSPPIAKPI